MSNIDVFRKYLKEYQPNLISENWMVNLEIMERKELPNKELRNLIPPKMQQVRCLIFFYIGEEKNVVYLLQDKQGLQNIGIGLLKDGELVKPISFV